MWDEIAHAIPNVNDITRISCMCPTKESRRYDVTPSLIGWAHTQNDPCCAATMMRTSTYASIYLANSYFMTRVNVFSLCSLCIGCCVSGGIIINKHSTQRVDSLTTGYNPGERGTESDFRGTVLSQWGLNHYNDVIMSAMASQITAVSSVCSIICSADQRKTSNLRVTGLCEGNPPVTVTQIPLKFHRSVLLLASLIISW